MPNESQIIIRAMRTFLRVLWMALLLITVALVSALVTMRIALHAREVKVPDLHGRTPSEARRLAEQDGLTAQVDRQYYSAMVPEGRVVSQTPGPGSVVRRGWSLSLAVSLGPQRVTIPQVVGQSARAAEITLQQRGLDISVSELNVPGATPGQVLAQDPPSNATDVAAPKVNLIVAAQNPAPGAYVMPSLVGRPLGSASLVIKDAGFTLGKVTAADQLGVPSPEGAPGQTPQLAPIPPNAPIAAPNATIPSPASMVVSQQPAAGQRVLAGSEIRLTVR
jgi:eukaryotic-like serine/threonine-protein kinase